MFSESGQMSAKTGVPPRRTTALAVAKNVKDGTMTSLPGFRSIAMSAISSASLPDAQATAKRVPQYSARFFSNCAISGPKTKIPESTTDARPSLIAGFSDAT